MGLDDVHSALTYLRSHQLQPCWQGFSAVPGLSTTILIVAFLPTPAFGIYVMVWKNTVCCLTQRLAIGPKRVLNLTSVGDKADISTAPEGRHRVSRTQEMAEGIHSSTFLHFALVPYFTVAKAADPICPMVGPAQTLKNLLIFTMPPRF